MRYELEWGLTLASRTGPVPVTRKVYNEQAGADTPLQPEIPVCGAHVWEWWWKLNNRRQPGFESVAPLSYTEIKSWLELTGKIVAPEEVEWLIEMDNAFLNTVAQERRDKQERDKLEAERKKQGAR